MNKKIIYLLLTFSLGLFAFTACSSDDDDLKLEKSEVSVGKESTTTVKITSGNGGYKITPGDATIATATIEGNTITITGVKVGETTFTVTDNEKKTTILKVTVTSLAQQIAATYNGELSIQLPDVEPVEKDIVLDVSGENIKMTLANFSFGEMSLGDIVVDEIPVEKGENEAVNIVETTKTVNVNLGETPIAVNITVSGTVSVKPKKATAPVETEQVLELTISVVDVLEEPIEVAFSGVKKAS